MKKIVSFLIREKSLFVLSNLLILVVLPLMSIRIGLNSDEPIDYEYGKQAYNYFRSGGKDTAFRNLKVYDLTLKHHRYYGSGFELSTYAVSKILHIKDEFRFRHLCSSLFGVLLILFTGLIAREVFNWKTGILSSWLMFFTPEIIGYSLWNGKDIPLAAGFAVSLYFFLRLIKGIPALKLIDIIGAAVGIAISVSIRIGGLMLVFYLAGAFLLTYLFDRVIRKNYLNFRNWKIIQNILIVTGICIVGSLAGLAFYPNFWMDPFHHLQNSVAFVKKVPLDWVTLYKGKLTLVISYPKYYLIESVYERMPALILLAFHAFFIFLFFKFALIDKRKLFLVLFFIFFPIIYILLTKATVYGGWHHILFIFSGVAVIASASLIYLTEIRIRILKWVFIACITAGLVDLGIYIYINQPYLYVYYNTFSGGLKNRYLKDDVDPLQLATGSAMNWFLESKELKEFLQDHDSVWISSTNGTGLKYTYMNPELKKKIKITYAGFKGYAFNAADFQILAPVNIAPKVLKMFYPPKGTFYRVKAENIPLAVIVRKANNFDIDGIRLLNKGNVDEGMELLKKAQQYDKTNFGIWNWLGYGFLLKNDLVNAKLFLTAYSDLFPDDVQSRVLLANSYFLSKDYQTAVSLYLSLYNAKIKVEKLTESIAACYQNMGKKEEAEKFRKLSGK